MTLTVGTVVRIAGYDDRLATIVSLHPSRNMVKVRIGDDLIYAHKANCRPINLECCICLESLTPPLRRFSCGHAVKQSCYGAYLDYPSSGHYEVFDVPTLFGSSLCRLVYAVRCPTCRDTQDYIVFPDNDIPGELIPFVGWTIDSNVPLTCTSAHQMMRIFVELGRPTDFLDGCIFETLEGRTVFTRRVSES